MCQTKRTPLLQLLRKPLCCGRLLLLLLLLPLCHAALSLPGCLRECEWSHCELIVSKQEAGRQAGRQGTLEQHKHSTETNHSLILCHPLLLHHHSLTLSHGKLLLCHTSRCARVHTPAPVPQSPAIRCSLLLLLGALHSLLLRKRLLLLLLLLWHAPLWRGIHG